MSPVKAKVVWIAGEVLVPSDTLEQLAFKEFGSNMWFDSFPEVLQKLSDYFYVSRDCLIARLNHLEFPERIGSWVAFLIAFSTKDYRGGGHAKLRIQAAVGNWNRNNHVTFYPGIEVEQLSEDFKEALDVLWNRNSTKQPLCRDLVFPSKRFGDLTYKMRLHSCVFRSSPQRALLVWGSIAKDS